MTLAESVKTCFRKYFTFSGRASRPEYWKFWLFALIVSTLCIILNTAIFGPTYEIGERIVVATDGTQSIQPYTNVSYDGGIFGTIFWIAVIVPGFAVASRRLHDTGRRGWWMLLPFAVTFGLIIVVIATSVGWTALIDGLRATGNVTVEKPSGGLVAIGAIFASWVMLLYWLCKASQPSPNRFGPNPHEVTE